MMLNRPRLKVKVSSQNVTQAVPVRMSSQCLESGSLS